MSISLLVESEELYPILGASQLPDPIHDYRYQKKSNQAHVRKNWSAVRRLAGCDRYSTKAAYHQLEYLYPLVELHANFSQPIYKPVGPERAGARVPKQHDRAQTPCQSGTRFATT